MKVQRCLIVMCLLVLLVAGSPGRASAFQPLEITQVAPTTIYNDLNTDITVYGKSFTTGAQVFLGADQLEVTAVDLVNGTITAIVPSGTEPGVYTLSVHTATEEASLVSAITVKSGFGQWVSNGPFGGEVTQILQAPQGDAETLYPYAIYAVTRDVGIFRSADGGAHWQFVFASGSPDGNLAMDAEDPNLLYATKIGEGLYRSQDGGDSWEAIPFDFQNIFGFYHIQTARGFPDPSTGNTVYAALSYANRNFECMDACGIYKSTDAGSTWTRISADIDNNYAITALAFNGTKLYAGTLDGKIFRSVDAGVHWAELSVGEWNGADPAQHVTKLAVHPSIGNLFWVNENGAVSLYRCSEVVNDPDPVSLSCEEMNPDNMDGADGVLDVQFAPNGDPGKDILISGYRPARSVNGGDTWSVYTDTSRPFQSSAVTYSQADANTVYAGNLQGFYVNQAAGVSASLWTRQIEGMTGLVPIYLVASPSQPQSVYVNTNGSGIYHSTNGGASWTQLPNFINDEGDETTLKTPLAVDPNDDEYLLLGTYQNKVQISEDGGLTWKPWDSLNVLPIPAGYAGYTFQFSFIEPVPGAAGTYLAGGYFMDPNNNGYRIYPAGGLYKSTDGGVTWALLYESTALGRIQAIAFAPDNPQTIYCATSTTDLTDQPERAALLYSTDGGQTWDTSTRPDSAEFENYSEILTLAVRPSTGALLADNGMDVVGIDPLADKWTRINGIEAAQAPINQLIYVPALGGTREMLYAATMTGLFQSTDTGANWEPAAAGLVGANVTVLDYAAYGNDAGIVYTGLAGGALAGGVSGASAFALTVEDGLIDGGVYHLTRVITDFFLLMPTIRR